MVFAFIFGFGSCCGFFSFDCQFNSLLNLLFKYCCHIRKDSCFLSRECIGEYEKQEWDYYAFDCCCWLFDTDDGLPEDDDDDDETDDCRSANCDTEDWTGCEIETDDRELPEFGDDNRWAYETLCG